MDNIREKLVEQLRELSDLTPPICQYQEPEEIELFGKKVTVYCKPFEQFQGLLREAADYIANNVKVQEWIPVSDPPKAWRRENGDMINYLIYTPEFGVDIGNYAAPANCWLCVALPCKPTHWAHLPQPPKGE